ncbi:MAG TPA: sugar nucleotide-binding protein [Verrucomicrobiae bacterium]|nr:sugar nucleotide-binding protein [Verrucomicrobiae bacterium]
MILLLGADGYVGQAFAAALQQRRQSFVPLTREALDYTRFELLFDYVRNLRPELIINGAGCSDVEAKPGRATGVESNGLLRQTVARVCAMTKTPWGQVRLNGVEGGVEPLPRNEECGYTWRMRLPFNEKDEPGNFLLHLMRTYYGEQDERPEVRGQEEAEGGDDRRERRTWRWGTKATDGRDGTDGEVQTVREGMQSMSQVDDCARACLELWEARAAFGIYNVVNPGAVGTLEVLEMIESVLRRPRRLRLAIYRNGAEEPGCVLDTGKLERAGVRLRPVRNALRQAVERWQKGCGTLRVERSWRPASRTVGAGGQGGPGTDQLKFED